MADVRIRFTEEERERLKADADGLGITIKQLVHDRALGVAPEDAPLSAVKAVVDEMAKTRSLLNYVILRETRNGCGLFEDDVIRLEMSMSELENIVTAFISVMLRQED